MGQAGKPLKLNTRTFFYNGQFARLIIVDCHNPQKYFTTKTLHIKKINTKICPITVLCITYIRKTHRLSVQSGGWFSLLPELTCSGRSGLSTPGYGTLPRLISSQHVTPKLHCSCRNNIHCPYITILLGIDDNICAVNRVLTF